MSAYGSREERQAWVAYVEASALRRRWRLPTQAATLAIGVLVLVAIVAVSSPWGWLLVPLPLAPHVVWRLATVYPEDRAHERWREVMDRDDIR